MRDQRLQLGELDAVLVAHEVVHRLYLVVDVRAQRVAFHDEAVRVLIHHAQMRLRGRRRAVAGRSRSLGVRRERFAHLRHHARVPLGARQLRHRVQGVARGAGGTGAARPALAVLRRLGDGGVGGGDVVGSLIVAQVVEVREE